MMQLWTFGVIVNLFLFYSVFDIYFKSPIVPVSGRHKLDKNVIQAPFKRVVFFSADGLRAETFFTYPKRRPYLTQVMERQSSVFGISDTAVPTESRPGHVALFAGFYEDPSAVFTGWQENTVEFDTVFNQSSSSIALGSADVVRMFAKGAAKSKMFIDSYPTHWQDFMSENLHKLDLWVFNYVADMIDKQKLSKEDGAIIFLHFLGTDTIGHAAKPESEAYISSMENVDSIIQKTEKLINNYYGDNDTFYIYTSDHGMTNWGSHGDGSVHETETPFVIWGNGIRKTSSEPLRLKQIDFAALMAGSLGIGFPSNSEGCFPYFMWEDRVFAFQALKANFHQIHDLMLTKKQLVISQRNFPIIKFPKEDYIKRNLASFTESEKQGDFLEGIKQLNETINLALEGVVYYQRYDDQLLTVFIVLSNVTWIVFVSCIVLIMSSSYEEVKALKMFSSKYFVISLLVGAFVIKVVIGWSLWRVPYGVFPVYLVILLMQLVAFRKTCGGRLLNAAPEISSLFLLLVVCALGVEILVNSFNTRGVLSLGLVLNCIWCIQAKKVGSWQKFLYFVSVALLAIFPLMPVIGMKRSPFFVTLGPVISTSLVRTLLYIRNKESSSAIDKKDQFIVRGQLILLLSVSVLCHFPGYTFTRIIAWTSLLQSYFLPVFTSPDKVTGRLISMFLAISSPFSFISFSYEALFFPCLFVVLMILLKIEMSEENLEDSWTEFLNLSTECRERRKLWEKVDFHQAVRRAWLHLFFVILSFFGTGNLASINSFDPSSTKCFVSVFSPWIMMLVIIEKMLGPFLMVSCFFRRLLWSKLQIERNFLIVLLLCQGMSLHTFFMVKNRGSWLEIGSSISHHVIVCVLTLLLLILHFIADYLMSYEPWFLFRDREKVVIPTSQEKRIKEF